MSKLRDPMGKIYCLYNSKAIDFKAYKEAVQEYSRIIQLEKVCIAIRDLLQTFDETTAAEYEASETLEHKLRDALYEFERKYEWHF